MKKIYLLVIFILVNIGYSSGQGQYQITFSGTVKGKHHDNKCTNFFNVRVRNNNNQEVTSWREDLREPQNSDKYVSARRLVPNTNPLNSLALEGERNWRAGTPVNRHCTGSYNTGSTTLPTNTSVYTKSFSVPEWSGTLTMNVYPYEIKLTSSNPSAPLDKNLFPTDDPIVLSATTGFHKSTYNWQYTFKDYPSEWDWIDLPSEFQEKSEIEIMGRDIFGNNVMDMLDHNTIYFRVKCSKTEIPIQKLQLAPRLSAPKIVKTEKIHNNCFGDSSGEIKIFFNRAVCSGEDILIDYATGNPKNISVFDGGNTVTLESLQEGSYPIQISGFYNGKNLFAGGASHKRTENITAPSQISFSSPPSSKVDILCFGESTGEFIVNASGGTGSFDLHWKKAGEASYTTVPFISAGSTTVENLSVGTYEFYVTDANGCYLRKADGTIKTETVTLTQPTKALEYDIINTSIKEPSGHGKANGSFSIKIDGGIPDTSGHYNVVWTNRATGAPVTTTTKDATSGFVSNIHSIPAGTYFATITDNNGCQLTTRDFVLEQPKPLVVAIEETGSNRCYNYSDGELTAHVKGGLKNTASGALPYKYKWSIDAGGGYTVIPNETDSILSNRKEGNYKVEIEDYSWQVNPASAAYTLGAPVQLVVSVLSKTDILCYGDNTGQVVINATGGTGGYKLYWKSPDDSGFPPLPVPFDSPSTKTINGLAAGTYSYYIVDNNNCSPENPDGTIKIETITLAQPVKAIEYSFVNIIEPSASGLSNGSLSVKVDGGTPDASGNYISVWKNKATGVVISTMTNSLSGGYFISTIANIPKGTYIVSITDNNGCKLEKEYTIKEPEPFTLTLEQTANIDCHGDAAGQLQAHAKGGLKNPLGATLPYKYTWYKEISGTYTVIPSQTDSILTGMKAGNYKVEVEDYSWLVNKLSKTHTISEPPLLTYQTASSTNILCYGENTGEIKITASGGTGNYWLYMKLQSEPNYATTPLAFDTPTSTTISGLYAEVYEYYVTDDNGCVILNSDGSTKTVTVTLTQPVKAIEYEFIDVIEPSGFGFSNGTISIKVNGGTPDASGNYFPVWKNKDTGAAITTVANKTEGGFFISKLHSIPKGTYTVNLTDNNGCSLEKEISINEPELLTGEIEETVVISCNGMSDGELKVQANGGTINPATGAAPYKYTWYKEVNGTFTQIAGEVNNVLSNLTTGNYRVEIEDYSWLANKVTKTYYLVEPAILKAMASNVHITCGQKANISVTVTGGTAPYKYEWSTGDTTSALSNLTAGNYFVFVTDSRGCETTTTAKVTQPVEMKITPTIKHPVCHDSSNGSISIQVSGGTSPYTYSWSNGATSQNLTNIKAGRYTLIATDANGCSWSESFLLTNPEKLTLDLGEDRTLCNDQKFTLAPTVSDPSTKFQWSGPDGFTSNKPQATLEKAGIYELIITDSKGCQATDQIKIEKDNVPISSEIAVASQAFVGDTIIIVNISNPHPDKIEWLVEKNDQIEIVEQDEHLIKLKFLETGHYSLGMRSHKNACFQDIVKTITVIEKEEGLPSDFGESIIKHFIVYPNPNSGVFTVKVDLASTAPIRLRLINIGSGNTVSDQKYSGKKEYEIPYNINITSGAYVMLLETAAGRMTLKMIKK